MSTASLLVPQSRCTWIRQAASKGRILCSALLENQKASYAVIEPEPVTDGPVETNLALLGLIKPVTSITVFIERLTKDEYEIDDLSDLPSLIEAIRLQKSTGPTEASRAIRKKLKYGTPHRQLRALTILDDLIQNAGSGFQRNFADEMLLERLRILGTDPKTNNDVKAKCQTLYRQWAHSYKSVQGMTGVANLYRQLPQRKRVVDKENSRVLRETERDIDDHDEPSGRRQSMPQGSSSAAAERRRSSVAAYNQAQSNLTFAPAHYGHQPASKHKKDKKSKSKIKPFNFEKEKPQINTVISQASIEATALMNALMHIDRERQRVSENEEVRRRFEACKLLRRQTFRFCSLVMDEGYLGALLAANDKLSDALILYEQLDKSFDYDSDSEDYDDPDGNQQKAPAMPPRPAEASPPTMMATSPEGKGKAVQPPDDEDEDDEDDPFADRNAISTPFEEKDGMKWGN